MGTNRYAIQWQLAKMVNWDSRRYINWKSWSAVVTKIFYCSNTSKNKLIDLYSSDNHIQEIVGIFETNAIEIRLAASEINALYEIGSMMEHTCVPNVTLNFDSDFNVSVYILQILFWEGDFIEKSI